jgi:hypothetical protein
MSTSITKYSSQIVVYLQKEMLSELHYWVVEVWKNFDELKPYGNERTGKAQCLLSIDNMNWDISGYGLTNDTLESLIAKATKFIKEQTKEEG